MSRRRHFKILSSLSLAAVLSFGAATMARAEMVYNRGNSGDMATLDPQKTSTVQESHITRDAWEGLTQWDAKGEAIPGTAESWTVSDDGTVYTFKIRDNAKWSNGDSVKAGDFVFAFRRMVDPATAAAYAAILYPIKNAEEINASKMKPEELAVRAVSDKTLEVTLRAPTPYFTAMLTHQAAYPLHKASMDKFGADWVKPGNLVTNGAYTFSEFIPKDRITLVKNKNYYDADKVKIDTVKYIPIEDRGAAMKRFENGEIDTYDQFSFEQMPYIRANLDGRYFTGPYLGTYYYPIRTDKAPYNNPKLRRALALAVDREYLAEKIYNGTMTPAYSLIPPGLTGYSASYADYKDMSQLDREDEAKKLMEGLGYGPDKHLKLEISYNTGEDHKAAAVAISNMWKNIYVDVSLTNRDGKTHYNYLQDNGDYDVARAGWIADFKDPQTFLAITQTGDGNNYSHYSNPQLDDWLKKAAFEKDAAARFTDLGEAEKVVMAETPVIVLLYYNYHNLVAKKVQGFEQNIMDVHPTKWMSIDASRS